MNVMVLTSERCGCSWVGAIVGEVYRQVYGEILRWNYEISRFIATDPKYNLPKGFSSVYYVRPQALVDREYDKILILHRDLESLKRMLSHYYFKEKYPTALKKYPEFFSEIEYYYDIVFDRSVEDPRLKWVELADLNNYPVATFHEIFDFLEFPREKRPVLLPINPPERDWAINGTIMPRGVGFDPYQVEMQSRSARYIEHQFSNATEEVQFLNPIGHPNSYKLSPEEFELQDAQVFRIRPQKMPDAMKILDRL